MELHPEIFLLEDFLSAKECYEFIAKGEKQSFEEAKVNIGGNQVVRKGVRNNDRLMFFDQVLAANLWKRVKEYLPHTIGQYEAFELNEMFRIYRYTKGQQFRMHYDGSYERNAEECSLLSFIIYLNDNFLGGETEFRKVTTVEPKTGQALIFYHENLHEGKEVTAGTKYVLRTDVMYKLNKI